MEIPEISELCHKVLDEMVQMVILEFKLSKFWA
jgi:hypothetical protein